MEENIKKVKRTKSSKDLEKEGKIKKNKNKNFLNIKFFSAAVPAHIRNIMKGVDKRYNV